MSTAVNFSSLQLTTTAASTDRLLLRNSSALSGADGFNQISVGNIERALTVYSTVQSNSATTWNYQGTDVKSLTSNWEGTYTNFNTQSANNISVYSTVNSNSATTWNYQGSDVKALTANWQNTYTNFSTQSANNISVYSTVNSNSATTWNYQGTDIKALTANYQNTYTGFSTQSASNASVYSTVNANSGNWSVFTGTISAATFISAVTSTAVANYQFALTDRAKTTIDTYSTNAYYGVPSNNTVAFPTGSQLIIVQGSKTASNYTILSAGTGVTINSFSDSLSLAGNYAAGTLIKTDTNTWYLIGNLK